MMLFPGGVPQNRLRQCPVLILTSASREKERGRSREPSISTQAAKRFHISTMGGGGGGTYTHTHTPYHLSTEGRRDRLVSGGRGVNHWEFGDGNMRRFALF